MSTPFLSQLKAHVTHEIKIGLVLRKGEKRPEKASATLAIVVRIRVVVRVKV